MLKTITLLLITLTTLLLVDTAHTEEGSSNFRAPALSVSQVSRAPAIIPTIDLI